MNNIRCTWAAILNIVTLFLLVLIFIIIYIFGWLPIAIIPIVILIVIFIITWVWVLQCTSNQEDGVEIERTDFSVTQPTEGVSSTSKSNSVTK